MRAFILAGFDTPPALSDDLPAPVPAEHEVLVRVRASSVNPVDAAISAGMLAGMLEHEFPVVLGRDYAGVVEEVGGAVTGFAGGRRGVRATSGTPPRTSHDGAWAELIADPEQTVDRHGRRPALELAASRSGGRWPGITALLPVDALDLVRAATPC